MTSYILVKKAEYRISKRRIIINLFDDLGIFLLGKPLSNLLQLGYKLSNTLRKIDIALFALAVSFLGIGDMNSE
ncbi:hypothetical protein OnM2_051040 [Erysiphe neolycopersici]|uniref:Uncharacterized protein n=1 Tax=Erysiphe neolycopersici TaxID=212602 RepID=A0A420HSK6_9PEZI|nr:hypothetical protein OnM2_051040 [Erysiphe neolycopersici]